MRAVPKVAQMVAKSAGSGAETTAAWKDSLMAAYWAATTGATKAVSWASRWVDSSAVYWAALLVDERAARRVVKWEHN